MTQPTAPEENRVLSKRAASSPVIASGAGYTVMSPFNGFGSAYINFNVSLRRAGRLASMLTFTLSITALDSPLRR